MPYEIKGKCIYKKDGGAKVGCTKGDVHKYMRALHANVDEDVIKGGKADNKSPQSIAKMHNVSVDKINSQIQKGIKVELEHVDSKEKAREIAMDHLVEMPDYYDRLDKMEKEASKEELTNITESKLLIKTLLRENLKSKNLFKQLEKDNKTTLPKIPTNKIFKNEVSFPSNDAKEASNVFRYGDDKGYDEFEDAPIETVNVADIIPTQKVVNIDNLKDTSDVGNNTKAYLLKDNGKYYVIDGHHRISNRILNGDKAIKAHVRNRI